jgi:hypothetical protein
VFWRNRHDSENVTLQLAELRSNTYRGEEVFSYFPECKFAHCAVQKNGQCAVSQGKRGSTPLNARGRERKDGAERSGAMKRAPRITLLHQLQIATTLSALRCFCKTLSRIGQ